MSTSIYQQVAANHTGAAPCKLPAPRIDELRKLATLRTRTAPDSSFALRCISSDNALH
jgi:hypothetical protein